MKFAIRDGSTARTLAVTSPGWVRNTTVHEVDLRAPIGTAAEPRSLGAVPTPIHSRPRRMAATTSIVPKGGLIFGPGQGQGLVHIVRSGCVRIYKTLPDGRSINLGLLGPNTIFTQEDAYDGLATGTTAEALVESTVSVVEASGLATLIAESPELASSMVRGMTRRLTELQMLAEQLLVRDTSVRLATTLLTLAKGFGRPTADGMTAITLPLTHQGLANMIGSNRVTVTRKLVELQDKGLVRSLGRNALAVDPDALRAHARAAVEQPDEFE